MSQYPNGKLNEHDEGATKMAVYTEENVVIVRFPTAVQWIGMEPEQAVRFAEAVIKNAMSIAKEPIAVQLPVGRMQ